VTSRRGLEDDIRLREFARRLVRYPADRGERDCGVCAQDALDLGRADILISTRHTTRALAREW
jgi:hypothetical protein